MAMTEFVARIAKPSDYHKVRRLCERAVGSDDYVIPRLHHVISQRGLFLAFCVEELVGMSNFSVAPDGAGWLGMARTDPDWRRKGVAIFLQRAKAEYARKKGIREVRLFVLSSNTPSLRACLKGGFKPVCEASHMSLEIRESDHLSDPAKLNRGSLRELVRSKYVSKMGGYVGYNGFLIKVDLNSIEKISKGKEIYSNTDTSFILTKPDRFEFGRHREFSLLSGPIQRGLKTVIGTARKHGSTSIGTFIPYDQSLIRSASGLGFARDPWGSHCICLEKQI